MSKTLYGLKQDADLKIFYDVEKAMVVKIEGSEFEPSDAQISEEKGFSLPIYIIVGYQPYYPSKYEFINEGIVVYASKSIPSYELQITDNGILSERSKTKQNTIGIKDLLEYDRKKARNPSQNSVMKESAKDHAQKLIDQGILTINSCTPISWHWCHLVAFSMLPASKSQKKNNLFCGTAACNGHMTNIETAVKKFIYEFKRPLGLEVTVTTYQGSELARRIRYRIFDKKGSQLSHTEYFDALTHIKTDVAEAQPIYDRMVEKFTN